MNLPLDRVNVQYAEPGPIRIFPATPTTWREVNFHNLRAEGAFLVLAKRENGVTTWIQIKGLAGEPCTLKVDAALRCVSYREWMFQLTPRPDGIVDIDLTEHKTIELACECEHY